MDWKDIGNRVAKTAPLLGTLLGGPAGAAVGALVASALGTGAGPDEVSQALITDPNAAIKLKEIESKRQVDLQALMVDHAKAEYTATVSAASEVNKTMQAEAAAEHWPTYTWRPFIGFIFGVNLLIASLVTAAVYIAVMFGSASAAAALATLPAMIGALGAVNGAALPILGIASWFRGRMQADPAIPTTNKG
jgi:roadblock/LC7 domain-containing protein